MKTVLPALLFAVFSSVAAGQIPPATPDAQPEDRAKRFCKLEGQVISQVTNAAIRKAKLSLKPSAPGATARTTESDADGKFSFENVDPGRYTLSAERQGFVSEDYGARRPPGPGTVISLSDAQHLKDLVFKLTPQGVIAGRVLDDEGEPVVGVIIEVLQQRYILGRKRLVPAASGTQVITNDLGEYRASNLSPSRYYVACSAQRLTLSAILQSGPEQPAGKEPEEGDIPVYYPNSPDIASASTVEVGAGAELAGIDLRLRKGRVVRVSGTLMSAASGRPMRNALLRLMRRGPGTISSIPVALATVRNENGTFELRNVPPGPYTLITMAGNSQDMMMTMTSLDVGDKNVEGHVVTLGGGVEIPVTAKVEAANKDISLAGVRVLLRLEENPAASLAMAQLEKDNKGVLKRVTPDKYRLVVSGLPDGVYVKSARLGDREVLESGLAVQQGDTAALELLIAGPSAGLTGGVSNEKGEPVPGAIVSLVPADAKGRSDLFRTNGADQNGNFRIWNIVPGEYKLFAWEDIDPWAAEDDDFRKPFESRAVTVKLSEGSNQSVRLTLITREAVEAEAAKR